ncbi:MAG: polyhydroxyalkanoate synthesis repressor PhaR [Paracoccaceae bacterium]
MAKKDAPLLIKRYASRRLYNTETSDYVTLEDISGFIRDGREVQIVDLKSGDDLTRQYLLQIIAEHESKGESVLPVDVLNDLVRSYMTPGSSVVPQFLEASFDMLRNGQSQMLENMNAMNPMSSIPGFDAIQAQQQAFLKAMASGMPGAMTGAMTGGTAGSNDEPAEQSEPSASSGEDLDAIKAQLADLQDKLSKLK